MEEALRAAIRDSPKDEMPRLIYSDWLDDQGRYEEAARIRWDVENKLDYLAWEEYAQSR